MFVPCSLLPAPCSLLRCSLLPVPFAIALPIKVIDIDIALWGISSEVGRMSRLS